MKTAVQIKKDIAALGYTIDPDTKKQREKLTNLLLYIETNPKQEVIERQLSRIETQIKILQQRYNNWCLSNGTLVKSLTDKGKNPETYYSTLFKIPSLREQSENLKYLLS